ncbi:MAG: TRAP transporter substrate-binding protein [Bacteriovoracia bacterium]
MKLRNSLFLGLFFLAITAHASTQLKWIFAHGPVDEQVLDLMKKYSRSISAQSQKKITVQLENLPLNTWDSHKGWVYRWNEALKKLSDGSVDVGQIYTDELVDKLPKLEVFDLPFLFRDHEHVEKVLNGEIGRELLAELTAASAGKMRAIAFTYSGGFRVVASSREIKTADAFKDMRISEESTRYRSGTKVLRLETFKALGSNLVSPDSVEGHISLFAKKKIDMYTAPWKEVLYDSKHFTPSTPKFVSDDRMSLFTTVILVSENAFQKLSRGEQKILTDEINSLAREERELFIREAVDAKAELQKMGVKTVSMEATEIEKMRRLAQPIYLSFTQASEGNDSLVKRIQSVK